MKISPRRRMDSSSVKLQDRTLQKLIQTKSLTAIDIDMSRPAPASEQSPGGFNNHEVVGPCGHWKMTNIIHGSLGKKYLFHPHIKV